MRGVFNVFSLLAAMLISADDARADLLVAPLRQVITVKEPVARYRISNPSDRILEARIDWIDLIATPEGYGPASADIRAKLSAAPFLIVSPARLRLEPGGSAQVIVRLKPGARMPAGERRSHLLVQTIPARTPLRKASAGLEVDVGLGVSTPVILRSGYAAPTVTFEQSTLARDADGTLAFETTMRSDGRYSAYGVLEARLESEGRVRRLATLANVAVYPDSGARRVRLPLGLESLPAGRMTIIYSGADSAQPATIASKTFDVAPPSTPPVTPKKVSSPR